jgi:hypothetical protein
MDDHRCIRDPCRPGFCGAAATEGTPDDPVMPRNNAALVANAAVVFGISTIPTTVAEKDLFGATGCGCGEAAA